MAVAAPAARPRCLGGAQLLLLPCSARADAGLGGARMGGRLTLGRSRRCGSSCGCRSGVVHRRAPTFVIHCSRLHLRIGSADQWPFIAARAMTARGRGRHAAASELRLFMVASCARWRRKTDHARFYALGGGRGRPMSAAARPGDAPPGAPSTRLARCVGDRMRQETGRPSWCTARRSSLTAARGSARPRPFPRLRGAGDAPGADRPRCATRRRQRDAGTQVTLVSQLPGQTARRWRCRPGPCTRRWSAWPRPRPNSRSVRRRYFAGPHARKQIAGTRRPLGVTVKTPVARCAPPAARCWAVRADAAHARQRCSASMRFLPIACRSGSSLSGQRFA